jgi:hypothetical protein
MPTRFGRVMIAVAIVSAAVDAIQAICTDTLHFRARVPVIPAAKGCQRAAT